MRMMLLFLVTFLFLMSGFPALLSAGERQPVVRGPVAQSCLDDPPSADDTFMVSLCKSFDHEENRLEPEGRNHCDLVCQYPETKRLEDIDARKVGKAWAAEREARQQVRQPARTIRAPSLDQLDAEIARMEHGMAMMFLPPMPMIREPIHCTSYSLGMFVNAYCD